MVQLKFYVPQHGPVLIDKSETKIVRLRNGRYAFVAMHKMNGKTVKLFRFASKSEVEGKRPKRGAGGSYKKTGRKARKARKSRRSGKKSRSSRMSRR